MYISDYGFLTVKHKNDQHIHQLFNNQTYYASFMPKNGNWVKGHIIATYNCGESPKNYSE